MLTVDKINKLEYYNNKMINTLIAIRSILIDGYDTDMVYTAIDNSIDLIDRLDREVSHDYKRLSSM